MRYLIVALMLAGCGGSGAELNPIVVMHDKCDSCHARPPYSAVFNVDHASDFADAVERVLDGAETHPTPSLTDAELDALMRWSVAAQR